MNRAITPFDMVFTSLWETLLKHPVLKMEVREGNRIRFDVNENRDPVKAEVAAGDLPEIMIVPASLQGGLFNTSSSSKVTRVYSILVSTGDKRYTLDNRLAQVEWWVFVAALGWKKNISALTWKDAPFVKRVEMISGNMGMSDPNLNRGITGWTCIIQIEVEMHFKTSDLLSELLCQEE